MEYVLLGICAKLCSVADSGYVLLKVSWGFIAGYPCSLWLSAGISFIWINGMHLILEKFIASTRTRLDND